MADVKDLPENRWELLIPGNIGIKVPICHFSSPLELKHSLKHDHYIIEIEMALSGGVTWYSNDFN